MGIPVYFKTILREHSHSILHKPDHVHNLFFDLNCLIHPCCSSVSSNDETEMIDTIKTSIKELITYTNVSELIYISIDGPAPRAKMEQQKKRRYKNIYSTKLWDTNAITPGTYFMKRLNKELHSFIQTLSFHGKIILDDSENPGEGEHKILHYLQTHKSQLNPKINIIYGLDSDLIMLSLVSEYKHIFLLRERTDYNIEDLQETYIYLDISILRNTILKTFNLSYTSLSSQTIINDYIFMCFFLGNDFIKNIPSLSLRYNGYDHILSCYKTLQKRYNGYFYLVNQSSNSLIYLPFLKEWIHELSLHEDNYIQKIIYIRNKQSLQMKCKYQLHYEEFLTYCNTHNDCFEKNKYDFLCNKITDRKDYELMFENIPLLDISDEDKIFKNINQWKKNYNQYMRSTNIELSSMYELYLQSIVWTTHYYFKSCYSWSHHYPYDFSPTLYDFSKYLQTIHQLDPFIIHDTTPTNCIDQLNYVLPSKSHHLFTKKPIPSKDKLPISHHILKRYSWE